MAGCEPRTFHVLGPVRADGAEHGIGIVDECFDGPEASVEAAPVGEQPAAHHEEGGRDHAGGQRVRAGRRQG